MLPGGQTEATGCLESNPTNNPYVANALARRAAAGGRKGSSGTVVGH
jgi:hypothetical protein